MNKKMKRSVFNHADFYLVVMILPAMVRIVLVSSQRCGSDTNKLENSSALFNARPNLLCHVDDDQVGGECSVDFFDENQTNLKIYAYSWVVNFIQKM